MKFVVETVWRRMRAVAMSSRSFATAQTSGVNCLSPGAFVSVRR